MLGISDDVCWSADENEGVRLCLGTEWSHMASQHSHLHKKTCYFGEEALGARDTNCRGLRVVWELSLLMVWALIATQVSPGPLLPYWTQDLLITVQEVTAAYFWSADRSFSPLSQRKTSLNVSSISFFLFFSTGGSSSIELLFFFI